MLPTSERAPFWQRRGRNGGEDQTTSMTCSIVAPMPGPGPADVGSPGRIVGRSMLLLRDCCIVTARGKIWRPASLQIDGGALDRRAHGTPAAFDLRGCPDVGCAVRSDCWPLRARQKHDELAAAVERQRAENARLSEKRRLKDIPRRRRDCPPRPRPHPQG